MRAFGVTFLFLCFVSLGHAQQEFAWKWQTGKTLYFQTETKTKQTLVLIKPEREKNIDRRTITSDITFTVVFSLTPKGTNNDQVQLEQKILEVKAVRPEGSPIRLVDIEDLIIKLEVSPKGKVSKVEGHKEILDALLGSDRKSAKSRTIQGVFSEEALKNSVEQALAFLPEKAINKGDTWKQEKERKLGPLGTLKITHNLQWKANGLGDKKNVAEVKVLTTLDKFTPVASDISLFQVSKANFKKAQGTGTIYFDLENGQLTEANTTVELEGELTLKSSTGTYNAEIEQKQTIKTSVTEKNPLE